MPLPMKFFSQQPLSLRMILIVYVVAPLATSLAVTGYLALKLWEHQVETRMKSDLEMVARAIQLPLSHALERNRQGGVEQALESAFSIDSVYSAYAYDLSGKEIASVGKESPDVNRGKLTQLAFEGKQAGEYGRVGDRRVYSHFIPLTDSRDQTSGLLHLTRRERDFRDYIGKVRYHALTYLSLGVLLMSGLVLIGQHQALGQHFKRLTSGMKHVAGGDVAYRIPLQGPREIRSIAASFNQMLDSIQNAECEIRRNRQEQLGLEQQLRQAEKLAAIGQLAAGVAHELGTPLSTISGTAQRGLRHESPDSPVAKAFTRIRDAVNRMEVIIRQLLDFSHSRQLQCRNLQPEQVANSALTAVVDEAAQRDVELSLSGSSEAATFSADPIRLEQALVNLLRNAIQADTQITVRLSWRAEDRYMIFAIDDSGPGISEKIRPRLFEPFFTTKNVGAGTGLGLAVVHGITKEHGGDVHVGKSDLGGARIEIRLPMSSENRI